MNIIVHHLHGTQIGEIVSDACVVNNVADGSDLVGKLFFDGIEGVIIHEQNLAVDFFDLKNGLAGEILQKFSTYRIRLAIVGDFSKYTGKSLNEFIAESNRGRLICFVSSMQEALGRLSAK